MRSGERPVPDMEREPIRHSSRNTGLETLAATRNDSSKAPMVDSASSENSGRRFSNPYQGVRRNITRGCATLILLEGAEWAAARRAGSPRLRLIAAVGRCRLGPGGSSNRTSGDDDRSRVPPSAIVGRASNVAISADGQNEGQLQRISETSVLCAVHEPVERTDDGEARS